MPQKKIAIVTGASSGLGREFARLLVGDGQVEEVWAIARNQERLEELQRDMGEKIRWFALDLSEREEIERFVTLLAEAVPEVLYLVNNAGYAKFGSYEDVGIAESMNMIALNCSGVVAMGLACLPYMKRGAHIINIASAASFQPLPYQNIYSSTKAFVRNYSRALNVELKERGITVTAVCPGWIKTNLYARAEIGARKGTRKFPGMVTPEQVATRALRDARRGRDMSVYGGYTRCIHIVAKLLPQRMMMKLWLKQQGL